MSVLSNNLGVFFLCSFILSSYVVYSCSALMMGSSECDESAAMVDDSRVARSRGPSAVWKNEPRGRCCPRIDRRLELDRVLALIMRIVI